jgi:hypothetical protein
MGQETCVRAGCYKDVLVIAETSQSEPDAEQLKYWAPNVGNVRVGWRGAGEKTKETLELVEVVQLSPEALAEVRAKALELEKSAHAVSKDVYALTQPLQDASGAIVGPTPLPASAQAPQPTAVSAPAAQSTNGEVVVYAADIPESGLFEFEVWDDPASPGGKLLGITNTGDEVNAPPENDPHVTFTVPVQSGIPYRCWIHMKVGAPKGLSTANKFWVQFSQALDTANQQAFTIESDSYLTAQGPTQEGWSWVGCDREGAAPAEALISFPSSGEVTVRVQAGMEGTGFDQLVLSPAQFLDKPPSEAVVAK